MRRISALVAAVAVASTGAYFVIYLVRWEWHRALLAGVLLVAAEVLIAGGASLRRLRALDERLDRLEARLQPGPASGDGRPFPTAVTPLGAGPSRNGDPRLARIRSSAPQPAAPFAWLESQQMSVFLPVLLGAGVLASALAWMVEHLARATARPGLERRLARDLAALSLPPGGLLGGASDVSPPPRPARRGRRLAAGLAVLGSGTAGAMAYEAIEDATASRPDVRRPDVHTAIHLRLAGSPPRGDAAAGIRQLWGACAPTIRTTMDAPDIVALASGVYRFVVPFDLGVNRERRFRGCLQDATIDHLQAEVVEVSAVPAARADPNRSESPPAGPEASGRVEHP